MHWCGRPAVELRARPGERSWFVRAAAPSDEYRLLLDAEVGVVVWLASYREAEPLDLEELLGVVFDEPLPPGCFEPPTGHAAATKT